MSPWNYPVLLTLEPLVDALAAGNTVILKPSAYAPCTSQVLSQLLTECYPPEYVTMITGGREENQALLNQRFDKIFFTGGKTVGKEVLRHAAEYLTPVTLELGGKSPCIIDATAKISLAARRIVFGKYLNCGQTCVAPDYILCDASIRDQLLQALKKEIHRQFGKHPLQNPDYGKIINEKHFHRLQNLIATDKLVCGGQSDPSALRIAPTILKDVTWDDPVMGEEIFGPILPVLTYSDLNDAIALSFHRRFCCKKESPCQMSFWRRMHQRYHYPSCYQPDAIRRGWRKWNGMLSWERRICMLYTSTKCCR